MFATAMTTKEYRIDKLAANKLVQRINILFPVTGTAICGAAVAQYYYLTGGHPFDDATLLVVVPVVVLATALIWRSFIKSSKDYFETYKLTLTDNAIVMEVGNGPERGIEYGKTASISETSDGTITAISRSGKTAIKIHKYVERREELKAALNHIRPITSAPQKKTDGLVRTLAALAFLVCGAVATFSQDSRTVAICGYVTGTLIAAGCVYILFSKNTGRRPKILAGIALGVLIAGLAALCLLKLS